MEDNAFHLAERTRSSGQSVAAAHVRRRRRPLNRRRRGCRDRGLTRRGCGRLRRALTRNQRQGYDRYGTAQ